jgi:uncharacterized protein (DUF1800 family)/fibronectin type 3 domain-containing protein
MKSLPAVHLAVVNPTGARALSSSIRDDGRFVRGMTRGMNGNDFASGESIGLERERMRRDEAVAVGTHPDPVATARNVGLTVPLVALSSLGLAACGGGGGSSPAAASSSSTTAVPSTPSTPSGLAATPENGQVALIWSPVEGATGYSIGRATNSGGPFATVGTSTSTSFTDTKVTNGTAYYYVVSASNAAGSSANSAAVPATPVAPAPALSAPTGLAANGGNAVITLTWAATTGATSYSVSRALAAGGPFSILGTSSAPSYTDSTVTNGTTYYYLVSARNASSSSGNSDVVSATPAIVVAIPAAPTNLVAAAGNAQVSLTWTTSAGAAGYNVLRATVTGGPYTAVGTPVSSPFVDTTASNGTTYFYVLTAQNSAGTSANSAEVSAKPQPVTPPASPTGLAAIPGNAQVSLSWATSPGATSYVLSRQTLSGGAAMPTSIFGEIANTASTGYIDTQVINGTPYVYVVAAVNAAGQSPASAAVAATPLAGASAPLSRTQAARVLAQAAFGGSDTDIQNLQNQASGIQGWLEQQFAIAVNPSGQLSNVAWMQANGLISVEFDTTGVQSSLWRKLISSPDVLRQRMMLALTDLFVVNTGATQLTYRGAAAAYYLDQLEANAFGNFRGLLLAVSHTPAMGQYLTFLDSLKANPVTGTSPDENYAREVMQLFSIGVVQLNLDGTPVANAKDPGVALATYSQTDVLNMAKVFTGWKLNAAATAYPGASAATDMINEPSGFDSTEKFVLGRTIAAGLDGEQTLEAAIGILMQHPNIAPFISRQFIQRLVTSNPSADYVYRVATVFQVTQGDMKSIITAILTDPEATSAELLSNPEAGKLREPVVRFIQWARTFQLNFAPGLATQWAKIGDLSNPSNALAESPLQSPNVFFFFQPGYIPPQTALEANGITAPEFGITNESSVAGYMNFIKHLIANGIGGVQGNYSALVPLVNQGANSAALLAELNVLIAAGQVSAATLILMQSALDTMAVSTPAGANNRLYAALTLIMCAPEYLVQK